MASGSKAFRKLQMGLEVTPGTAATATRIWRGTGGMAKDDRQTDFVEEHIGIVGGVGRTNIPKYGASFTLDPTPATFQFLPSMLTCGVKAMTSGATDTGGSGKVYTFTAPSTALNTISTATFESGDNQRVDATTYCFMQEFTLEGKGGEAVMVSSKWAGQAVADDDFTTNIALAEVSHLNFGKSKLYIDASSGTVGTTQVTGAFKGASLKVNTGWIPEFCGDGSLYFATVGFSGGDTEGGKESWQLEVTFLHDSTCETELTAFRNQTWRQIQWKIEGNTLGSAGTYTHETVKISMAGKWKEFSEIQDQDGNDIMVGTFKTAYLAAKTLKAEIVVVNEEATAF